MTRPFLTLDRLRGLLDYDAATGEFRWRVMPGNHRAYAGQVAGGETGLGYIAIGIDGRKYLAHRLAWFWVCGEWPAEQIDHRDGCGLNNSWSNLRAASPLENAQNKRRQLNNRTGYPGVSWDSKVGKYRARIKVGRREHWLGNFDSPEDAFSVYLAAKAESHKFQPVPRAA